MLTRNELSADIHSNLHEELSKGNSYAHALLTTGYSGKVFTFLPLDIHPFKYDLSRLVELSKTSNIPSDGKKAVYDDTLAFLETRKNGIALIETYYHPNDISKLRNIPHIIYSGDEIYFFLSRKDDFSSIASGFRSARDYPFICGFIDLENDGLEIREQQQVSTEFWTSIASKTRVVIIGAYDAIGYLIWERDA